MLQKLKSQRAIFGGTPWCTTVCLGCLKIKIFSILHVLFFETKPSGAMCTTQTQQNTTGEFHVSSVIMRVKNVFYRVGMYFKKTHDTVCMFHVSHVSCVFSQVARHIRVH